MDRVYLQSCCQQHLHAAAGQGVNHASQHSEGSAQQLVHVQGQHSPRLAQVDSLQALQRLLQSCGLGGETARKERNRQNITIHLEYKDLKPKGKGI